MIRRAIALSTLALTLSGCTYFGSYYLVDDLNKAVPKGSAFNQALTAQYKDRANYSQNVTYHYEQAYRNAERGLLTADNALVTPYTPDMFELPDDRMQEIAKARASLDKALANGAREHTPKEAATAQAKFDCWVEDAAKTWQPDLYQSCRKEFFDAMATISAMRGEPVDLSATDLNTSPAYAPDAKANRFMIFFGQSGAKLSPTTASSLDQIAQIIQQRQPQFVRVEGHADRSGSAKSKQKISALRATAVAEALIQRGVPKKILRTAGMSDKKSLINSRNKKMSINRRVEIWLDF